VPELDVDKYSRTLKFGKTQLSPEDEDQFQFWYKFWAKKTGISLDPDDPKHYYDYRASYMHGQNPELDKESGEYHWQSKFKDDLHPNRYIKENGEWYDTKKDTTATLEDWLMQYMIRNTLEGNEIGI
jgi:hypothetical protein